MQKARSFYKNSKKISGLPPGDHDESKIRKAYFKMAQNYHPDKNPNGRDMFEKVISDSDYNFINTCRIIPINSGKLTLVGS